MSRPNRRISAAAKAARTDASIDVLLGKDDCRGRFIQRGALSESEWTEYRDAYDAEYRLAKITWRAR